jgi:hypothetical protein
MQATMNGKNKRSKMKAPKASMAGLKNDLYTGIFVKGNW